MPYATFSSRKELVRWLLNNEAGQDVLRVANWVQNKRHQEYGEWLVPRTQYALVKAYDDGWLEVYGPRNLQVKVLTLPALNDPQMEIAQEAELDKDLPLPYAKIHYPSAKRATEMIPCSKSTTKTAS